MPFLSEILASMSDPQTRHAAIVHTPIAASVLGIPLVVALAFSRGRSCTLRWCTAVLYAILLLCAWFATGSGARALAEIGPASLEARSLIERHAGLARVVWIFALGALLGAAGTAFGARSRLSRLSLAVCVASAFATAGYVAWVGHLGGTAVYTYGLGTPARAGERAGSPSIRGGAPSDPWSSRFQEHVRPILDRSCVGCHGPGASAASGLDLTSVGGLLRGGERGPAIVPGEPEASLLYQVVTWTHDSLRMPLGRAQLTADELEPIRVWIEQWADRSE